MFFLVLLICIHAQKKLPLNSFIKNMKMFFIENKKYRVDCFCKAERP